MNVVGIVGHKGSGKTGLVLALVQELTQRGYRVATVKHASAGLDLPGKDTARHREFSGQVGVISPEESAVFFRGPKSLEEILSHLDADFVLIEGFNEEKTFPKIVCLKGETEDQELFDGLAICAVGAKGRTDVPLFDPEHQIADIADLTEEKAFKLPNLNCGACGYDSCYGLAREIVKGAKNAGHCVSSRPTTEIKIDGELLAINPFVSEIIRNTVQGMLSALKGFKKGKIEIRIG